MPALSARDRERSLHDHQTLHHHPCAESAYKVTAHASRLPSENDWHRRTWIPRAGSWDLPRAQVESAAERTAAARKRALESGRVYSIEPARRRSR